MAEDLQSAGVQAQPSDDASSLLKALSMGGAQQPMMQGSPLQQAQADPNMKNWAGLAGFGAGVTGMGQNPVTSQVMAQQEQDMRSRLSTVSVMQSAMKMRREKLQDQRKMALDLMSIDNPGAKLMGAQLISKQLQSEGVNIKPESLVDQGLSLEKRKQAYLSILAGQESGVPVTDEYLEQSLGVPKVHIPSVRQEATSEPIHKMLFGQSLLQERLAIDKADIENKKYDVLLRRADATDARQALAESREDRIRGENQIRFDFAERRARVSEAQLELSQQKFAYAQAKGPEEKRDKALDHAEWFANKLQEYSVKVDQNGFLPPGDKGVMGSLAKGDMRALLAKTKRMTDVNNPDWVFLTKHLQAEMIGYSRTVQNDIGPRAMQAFQGAIRIMEDPPSLAAMNAVVNGMRQAIQLGRDGKDTAQTLIIKHPTGQIVKVPWKRGMAYDPGDVIVGVE